MPPQNPTPTPNHQPLPPSPSQLAATIINCQQCPRLREYGQKVALSKRKAYQQETYWGKPVPGWGAPYHHSPTTTKLFILGLAPGPHGAHRTGRMFTGDRSGDWLYRALFATQFSNQPHSSDRHDGLELHQTYISCAVKCTPPQHRPEPQELRNCATYLQLELAQHQEVKVYLTLGAVAFRALWSALRAHFLLPKQRPPFQHGGHHVLSPQHTLLLSYHPSQQNTFTGVLTWEPWLALFQKARALIDGSKPLPDHPNRGPSITKA